MGGELFEGVRGVRVALGVFWGGRGLWVPFGIIFHDFAQAGRPKGPQGAINTDLQPPGVHK